MKLKKDTFGENSLSNIKYSQDKTIKNKIKNELKKLKSIKLSSSTSIKV